MEAYHHHLPTIVNHLDVVTRTSFAYPVTARFAVRLSSSFLENLLDMWPGSGRTTRHERRSISGTFLTTRYTGANEKEALGLKGLGTTN